MVLWCEESGWTIGKHIFSGFWYWHCVYLPGFQCPCFISTLLGLPDSDIKLLFLGGADRHAVCQGDILRFIHWFGNNYSSPKKRSRQQLMSWKRPFLTTWRSCWCSRGRSAQISTSFQSHRKNFLEWNLCICWTIKKSATTINHHINHQP